MPTRALVGVCGFPGNFILHFDILPPRYMGHFFLRCDADKAALGKRTPCTIITCAITTGKAP
ncbi:hypothetical protein TMES_04840 [Thalassospira mesophila]|uniref:Uncharacterized protein n=1 Tax=Thalassospira mesophila TaxID=1293891 RepID=A0A1Y2L224_9PROT|nr:hypothetical protein TMES_04840 [Thalassospira mesophila]